MRQPAIALLVIWLSARVAVAHIRLDYPAPRDTSSIKFGPCGDANSTRGSNVTVLEPGATIMVRWTETIDHPGHYRISFDLTGQIFTVPRDFNDTSQTQNVLVDSIPDLSGNPQYSQQVTLPDAPCESCTLQLIQMMTDKPPYDDNDIYFQCADIALRRGAVDAPPGILPDAPAPPVDAGGGCCQAGGTEPWPVIALLALGWLGRRHARDYRKGRHRCGWVV